jgi:hypothetical protein
MQTDINSEDLTDIDSNINIRNKENKNNNIVAVESTNNLDTSPLTPIDANLSPSGNEEKGHTWTEKNNDDLRIFLSKRK